MKKKSRKGVKDLGKAFNLFESIANEVYDRGGDDEDLCRIELESVLEKIADAILGAKKLALTKLVLLGVVAVDAESLTKSSFFGEEDSAKLYFHPSFQKPMFEAIPERVPAFKGAFIMTKLIKPMYDLEILYELGHPEPYYPEDFAAIMSYLVSRQMNKEGGVLLTNGYDNIFYLQLEQKKVFMVRLYWHVTNDRWSLNMCDLNSIGRHQGDCVFSRS